MEKMIKYEGKRDIKDQFYKFNGQLHDDLMDIVNTVIAPKLDGGRKVLRLMHFYYKDLLCGLHALCIEIDKKDGRIWMTGHTGDMKVETVTSTPLQDIDNRYLSAIIDHALFCMDKEDDGICGLLDADKYVHPKSFDYSCT